MLCVTIAKSHSGGSPLWWLLILLLQREQCFSCVPFRWQGNWIHRGAKRPENPVTRFPAGRRGPRNGEGVLEGKNRKETQSRAGRLSAVRIAAECHIGAWPRTPYGLSRGSEGGRREIFESYSSCTIPTVPPLVAAPPPFPLFRGHYGCWAFESIYVYGGNAGKPSQPPLRAKPGCKGFRPQSGHYNCARRAPPQPSARRAVKPKNPLNLQNPHARRARQKGRHHNPQPRRAPPP